MADPHLVTFLADRDEPCPACTYNLRGLQADRCPECNRELVLHIRLAEQRMGAWITALIATCTMLGFNGLLSIYFLIHMATRNSNPRDRPMSNALFISTGIAVIVLVFLLLRRRWFCNLHISGRVTMAVAAWGLAALSSAAFFSLTR